MKVVTIITLLLFLGDCNAVSQTAEVIDCRETQYGCCPDGITAAGEDDINGCPHGGTYVLPLDCLHTYVYTYTCVFHHMKSERIDFLGVKFLRLSWTTYIRFLEVLWGHIGIDRHYSWDFYLIYSSVLCLCLCLCTCMRRREYLHTDL